MSDPWDVPSVGDEDNEPAVYAGSDLIGDMYRAIGRAEEGRMTRDEMNETRIAEATPMARLIVKLVAEHFHTGRSAYSVADYIDACADNMTRAARLMVAVTGTAEERMETSAKLLRQCGYMDAEIAREQQAVRTFDGFLSAALGDSVRGGK